MPFESEGAFAPADPSQWQGTRALPRIIVQPKPPYDTSPPDGIDDWFVPQKADDGPDDWFVPGNARTDSSYPDDWFVPPPSTAPSIGQPAPGLQPNAANAAFSNSPAAPINNPPAARPNPVPVGPIGAPAWGQSNPPLFSSSFPTDNLPAPPPPSAPPIPPGSWPPPPSPDSSPPPGWASGPSLLGGIASLQRPIPAVADGGLGKLATLGALPTPASSDGGLLGALATLGTAPLATPLSSLARGSSPGIASPSMPGTVQAFFQGLGSATWQLAQTGHPGPPAAESPAAKPLGWSDLASPSGIAPKVAYQFAHSYPTLAAGAVGGAIGGRLGALMGPYGVAAGTILGGSLGAAALSAAQTLGPAYVAELQKTPNDPEGAWNRAWKQAEISGAFSGASWAVFPVRFFQGPVKQLVFQTFAAQPAVAVAEKATRNIVDGKPATEGLGEAYGEGVVGAAITPLGHKVVNRLLPTRSPRRRAGDQLPDPTTVEERGLAATSEQTSPTEQSPRSDVGPNRASNGRGVWDMPATLRGRILEKIYGHNLHPNHPTIDIWDPNTGAVTSLKSVDLEAPSYQVEGKYVNALYGKLSRDVDKLAEFKGGRYDDINVREEEITARTLTVIVPGRGTAEQRQVLRNIVEVGKQRGVIVKIEVYR